MLTCFLGNYRRFRTFGASTVSSSLYFRNRTRNRTVKYQIFFLSYCACQLTQNLAGHLLTTQSPLYKLNILPSTAFLSKSQQGGRATAKTTAFHLTP
jgi:hypothetical protein